MISPAYPPKESLVMTSDLHVISLVIFYDEWFHLSNASRPRRATPTPRRLPPHTPNTKHTTGQRDPPTRISPPTPHPPHTPPKHHRPHIFETKKIITTIAINPATSTFRALQQQQRPQHPFPLLLLLPPLCEPKSHSSIFSSPQWGML